MVPRFLWRSAVGLDYGVRKLKSITSPCCQSLMTDSIMPTHLKGLNERLKNAPKMGIYILVLHLIQVFGSVMRNYSKGINQNTCTLTSSFVYYILNAVHCGIGSVQNLLLKKDLCCKVSPCQGLLHSDKYFGIYPIICIPFIPSGMLLIL